MFPFCPATTCTQPCLFYASFVKVEEKRENFSQRKLRKPGEREREKYFAPYFEISHTKSEKTFL
jgi:hypothetical protein